MPGKQLLGGEQQTLGTAGLQLEFCLAQVLSFLAGAHLAVIDGQFDFAVLDLDAAGGALDNGLEYRAQRGAREGLPDGAADSFVGDPPDVGPFVLNNGLQFDRVGNATLDMLIDLHRLLPTAILAAQPKRDAGGVQAMLGSVEVDSPEFLCCSWADAEVGGHTLAGEPIQVGFAQFDLELQFLQEPIPRQCVFSRSRRRTAAASARATTIFDEHMTASLSSPPCQKCKTSNNADASTQHSVQCIGSVGRLVAHLRAIGARDGTLRWDAPRCRRPDICIVAPIKEAASDKGAELGGAVGRPRQAKRDEVRSSLHGLRLVLAFSSTRSASASLRSSRSSWPATACSSLRARLVHSSRDAGPKSPSEQ